MHIVKKNPVRKGKGKMEKSKRMGIRVLIILLGTSVGILTGCAKKSEKFFLHIHQEEQGKKEPFMICRKENQPERLQKLIKDRKKLPCTFCYKNSRYTYLVVCYGEKSYSGYSIRVEECRKTSQQLYLKTSLIGPSQKKEVVEVRTYPYIVVRCLRTELLCKIDS
ncbi:MAG: protease complex subunit PrcB family protein [Eubacterium sp.]|nr:protease complex subunit PrcB family protein [Eubacterium sp.]